MKIFLIISSIVLNSIAQLFMRKGMLIIGDVKLSTLFQSIVPMVTNVFLWLALLCYGISLCLWMIVLSKVEASYAVPFQSLGFVIVAVAGYYLFHENLNLERIAGILIVCVGVYLIAKS